MVRSVFAEESLLTYLHELGKSNVCSVGLILGQPTATKDFVIHLARTPQPQEKNVSEDNSDGKNERKGVGSQIKQISEIPESWVGDHARHATRMLPGGMYVLGIFLTSEDDVFASTNNINKIKSMLTQITKQLAINNFLHGNPTQVSEKLVLGYNTKNLNYVSKSLDTKTGSFKPAEFKFMSKPTKWHQLDCNFQFDQNFPISENKLNWTLKKHLQAILSTVESNFNKSLLIINGEIKDEDELLDSLGKKKKNIKSKHLSNECDELKAMMVDILLPCITNNDEDLVVTKCSGDMHFIGQLASRVFLHQKAKVCDAAHAVKEDILRSLAARFEMHWDSLIEEEQGSPEEKQSVHEPPRRVLIPLSMSRITLSDYLFPGEGPSEALISLQELLDLRVDEEDVIKDLEIQADQSDIYKLEPQLEPQPSEDNITTAEKNRLIYYFSLAVAFLVLVIALFVHFIKQ